MDESKAVDMSGAYLRHTVLSGSHIRGVCLEGADLRGASLDDVDALGAVFAGADLRGATLIRANLRFANFSGANLSHTNLWNADFTGACLDGTCLAPNAVIHEECRLTYEKAEILGLEIKDWSLDGFSVIGYTCDKCLYGDIKLHLGSWNGSFPFSVCPETAYHPGLSFGSLGYMRDRYPSSSPRRCTTSSADVVVVEDRLRARTLYVYDDEVR